VDIVGSRVIKESLSDEQSKIYYDAFIEHASKIVEKYNGVSVKVVGDSLLFYFPLASNITSEDAIECCLDIAHSNEDLNKKMRAKDLPGIAYRISSTVGNVHITKSTTTVIQDIFGEPVNHCFKINQYALPNTVAIEDSLYQRTKDSGKFKFTRIDQSLIKGLEYVIFIVSKK